MILNRYVQKTMLLFMASIVLVFLALQAILSFSSEFNSIGTGSYTLWHALAYVMLTSLSALYKIFPFIALLASLLSIHYLHKHHEITVMRASGMSMPMLCYAICTVGIVLTIASTLIGEAIAPRFERFAFTIKTKATSSNQFVATKQGLWLHDNHDFIYINKIQSEHALSGISRYTVDTKHNSFVKSSAKSAELINHQWVFKDIIENRFTTDGWKQHNFSEQTWTLPLTNNLMQSMMLNPEQLSLPQLYDVLQQREKSSLATLDQHLQFWQRLLQPVMTMVMLLFAIPFGLGSLRQSKSSFKLIFGLMLGFGCYFATYFVSTLAILNDVPAWLSATIPSVCLLVLALLGVWLQANQTVKPSDIFMRFKR